MSQSPASPPGAGELLRSHVENHSGNLLRLQEKVSKEHGNTQCSGASPTEGCLAAVLGERASLLCSFFWGAGGLAAKLTDTAISQELWILQFLGPHDLWGDGLCSCELELETVGRARSVLIWQTCQ